MPRVTGRSVRLTRRGWGVLAAAGLALLGAYALRYEELLVIGSLAACLVVAAALIAAARRPALRVARRFAPARVAEGDAVTVAVEVTNASGVPSVEGTWHDTAPWRVRRPSASLPAIASRQRVRVGYELRAERRGVVDVGPLRVDFGDPFGLLTVTCSVGGREKLVVEPRVSRLPTDGRSLGGGDGDAQLVQRRSTGGDDDLMTREYRVGDALRRVHWRASARHGELMVRQEEQRTFPEARLLLDTRRDSYGDVDRVAGVELSAGFEWAVRMAASLGVHLGDAGYRLAVLESAEAQVVQPGQDPERGARDAGYLQSLAAVQLTEAGGEAPATTGGPTGPGGPLFAVIADPSARVLRWIAAQRRPHDRAVAFTLPDARRATIDALSAAGWICVSVDPDDDPTAGWVAALRMVQPAVGRG